MDETTQTPQEIASDKGGAKMAQIIYFLGSICILYAFKVNLLNPLKE